MMKRIAFSGAFCATRDRTIEIISRDKTMDTQPKQKDTSAVEMNKRLGLKNCVPIRGERTDAAPLFCRANNSYSGKHSLHDKRSKTNRPRHCRCTQSHRNYTFYERAVVKQRDVNAEYLKKFWFYYEKQFSSVKNPSTIHRIMNRSVHGYVGNDNNNKNEK